MQGLAKFREELGEIDCADTFAFENPSDTYDSFIKNIYISIDKYCFPIQKKKKKKKKKRS